ncbi:MAG: FHA domain-containing protein [Oscillospiraceae bacterium]|nr:FHA domain-containing protein [Oscillospiraceae bacterium]
MKRNQRSSGQRGRLFKKIVALSAAVLLLAGVCMPFFASAAAEDVNKVKESIMVVQLAYRGKDGGKDVLIRGTGFLINETHLLTCYHIFDFLAPLTDSSNRIIFKDDGTPLTTEDLVREREGPSYNRNNYVREAVVSGDVTIEMNLRKESHDSDFSIMQLRDPISERVKKPAKLCDSAEGKGTFTTQEVYALGFPETVAQVQNNNTYTSADVTVSDGKISKVTSIAFFDNVSHLAQTPVLQHSAKLTPGNSGGPVVNTDGFVLGINRFVVTDAQASENFFYSISINQIKEILDTLTIKYESCGHPGHGPDDDDGPTGPDNRPTQPQGPTDPPGPDKSYLTGRIAEANSKVTKTDEYTKDSLDALQDKLNAANEVAGNSAAEQGEIESVANALNSAINDLVPKGPIDTTMIIIIAAAAVVVIAIIIIVVVMSKGSKKAAVPARPAPASFNPPTPSSSFSPTMPPVPPPAPAFGGEGAGETSLLNEGAGETSVLGGGAAGAIVNTKSGQRIAISRSEFTLGKERRKVDFVIDNSSVSRAHAKIRTRSGEFFILDLGSTNGTYVNGAKLTPNQETKLNSGDKIKISDEEFEFQG